LAQDSKMRAFLYASLVAFGAATDYDDDDLNFLRLLQSNASNATTVPATTVPATTVVSSNVTTAPATTVAATTTQGTINTGGSSTLVPATDICLAATYTNSGFASPGTLTQSTKGLGAECANGQIQFGVYMGASSTEANTMYSVGERALTAANTAKCTSPNTLKEYKCKGGVDKATLDWFNLLDRQSRAAVLHECCGVAPTPYPADPAPTGATLYAFPTVKTETFMDSGCATAATTGLLTGLLGALYTGIATDGKMEVSGCFDMGYLEAGAYVKPITCNSTATPAANDKRYYLRETHIQSTCDKTPWKSELIQLQTCNNSLLSDSQMQAANASTNVFITESCSGGSALSTLEIKTALEVVLSGLGSLTSAQKTTVLSTTCIKLRDETKTATGDAAAQATVESCTGTGVLSAVTFSGGRVRRRLSSHATINAVIATQVSAAGAAAAKAALDTAATSGTLSGTTLAATVVNALKQESSIASAVANVNATVSVTVYEPTIPTTTASTGGGSTAGAFAQGLSAVVGFLIMAMLFV